MRKASPDSSSPPNNRPCRCTHDLPRPGKSMYVPTAVSLGTCIPPCASKSSPSRDALPRGHVNAVRGCGVLVGSKQSQSRGTRTAASQSVGVANWPGPQDWLVVLLCLLGPQSDHPAPLGLGVNRIVANIELPLFFLIGFRHSLSPTCSKRCYGLSLHLGLRTRMGHVGSRVACALLKVRAPYSQRLKG